MKERIISALKKAEEFFGEISFYDHEIKESESKIRSLENDYNYKADKENKPYEILYFILLPLLIFCSVIYVVAIIASFLQGFHESYILGMYIPGAAVLGVIGLIFFLVCSLSKKINNKHDKYYENNVKPKIEEEKARISENLEDLNIYVEENKSVLDFLPEKYRTYHAVDYILDAFKSGEADNLKEAFALYNTYVYRLEMAEAAEEERDRLISAMKELNRQQEETNRNLKSMQDFEYWKYLNNK